MRIVILGSTGSIGKTTLRVIHDLGPPFEVVGLAVHSDIALLEEQIRQFHPKIVAVYDPKRAAELKAKGLNVKIVSGDEGLDEIASYHEADTVVVASTGIVALKPTLSAISEGKRILLANKEILVSAGPYLMDYAKQKRSSIIPIDSEHSAIFQCLYGQEIESVHRMILTASGGPFLRSSDEALHSITPEQALNHPTWKMGAKITIDCSTLLNKGFEVIEASYLFDMAPEKIEVIIHPQSLVHSFVEFVDGAMLAEIHKPDMAVSIQYGLTFPKRALTRLAPFDFFKNNHFDFLAPDTKRFRGLELAYAALREGGSLPCYLNAANEELVGRFIKREISWLSIVEKLEHLLEKHKRVPCNSIDVVYAIDQAARIEAKVI